VKAFHSRWLKARRSKAAGPNQKLRAWVAAQALAKRISQRYSLRGQPRRGMGMAYLQANQPAGLPQALRLSLHLSQRIQLAARPPLEMRLPASVPTAAPAAASSLPVNPASSPLQPPSPAGQGRIHMTYLQSLSRLQTVSHQRIEMGSPGAALHAAVRPAAAGAPLPLDRPAPMIARPAPAPGAQAAGSATPAEAAPPRTSQAESSAQAVERATAGLPPAELRRVTEQVIQEIDRRIIANRERFGRT
jgi:hypothetical protein